MSGEKTLPATQKKIEDARKKGQASVSKDFFLLRRQPDTLKIAD